jgi:hypothetical protein
MGAFTWTPNETQAPGVYKITVIAVADDSPLLSLCRTFAATVKGTPLRCTSFLLDSDSIFRARLTAIDGTNYTFQACAWRIVAHAASDRAKARETGGDSSAASRCKSTIWGRMKFSLPTPVKH